MTFDRPPESDDLSRRTDETPGTEYGSGGAPTEAPATAYGTEASPAGTAGTEYGSTAMTPAEPSSSGYGTSMTPTETTGAGSGGETTGARADVGTAWRQVGESLASLGSGVGDTLRQAWEGTTPSPKSAPEGLRQLADALERGIDTARSAATSPEARQRVNDDARRAGERLDRAVRLSIAEIGRTLQKVEPKD